MKKPKKKRQAKKVSFKGDPAVEPLEIVIVDGDELLMLFSLSNRALKMIKCGEVFSKTFLKDNKQCQMQFMHRDVYEDGYKQAVELKVRLQAEKDRQAREQAEEVEKGDDPEQNAVE